MGGNAIPDPLQEFKVLNPDFIMQMAEGYLKHMESHVTLSLSPANGVSRNNRNDDVSNQDVSYIASNQCWSWNLMFVQVGVMDKLEISPVVQTGLDLIQRVLKLVPGKNGICNTWSIFLHFTCFY